MGCDVVVNAPCRSALRLRLPGSLGCPELALRAFREGVGRSPAPSTRRDRTSVRIGVT